MLNMIPDTTNNAVLCVENQINCGKALKNPAKAAPAPTVTNSAGKAQQIKVLLLHNNVSV